LKEQTLEHLLESNWLMLEQGHEKLGSRHLLRRSFVFEDASGTQALCSVTAGSVYRLYVNGSIAMFGPARASSAFFFFDSVDVSRFLKDGSNTIAVETAYYPNNVPETIQYEFPVHKPGLSLCLELSNGLLTVDTDWKIFKLDAFDPNAPWARGIVSEYALVSGLPERDWASVDFDDGGWRQIGRAEIGNAPVRIEKRTTPAPYIEQHTPVKVTDCGSLTAPAHFIEDKYLIQKLFWFGQRKDGGQIAEIEKGKVAAEHLDRVQYRKICRTVSGGSWVRHPHAVLDEIEGTGVLLTGKSLTGGYVVYDFGWILPGSVFIEATIPEGVRVDVSLLEWLNDETGSPAEASGRVAGIMVGAGGFSLIGDGRRVRFESLQQHNARYVCVTVRDIDEQEAVQLHELRLCEICSLKPADCRVELICSDPILNRIVKAVKHTIRVNAHDYYVDCTCERIVTSGDCLQSSTAGRLFFGESGRSISETMFRLFIDQGLGIGDHPDWNKMPKGRCAAKTRKDDTMLWMIAPAMLVFDMLSYCRESLTVYPKSYRCFFSGIAENVENHLTPEGLIRSDQVIENWNDWSKMALGDRSSVYEGVNISVNAVYYRMFRELHEAFPDERIYKRLMEGLQKGLCDLAAPTVYSDGPRTGRFVADLYIRTNGSLHPFEVKEANVFGGSTRIVSEVTQYWLLWSGVLTSVMEKRLWDVLRQWKPFTIPSRDNTRMLNPSRASSIMGLFPRLSYLCEQSDPLIYQNCREAFGPAVLAGETLWEGLELDSRSAAHATAAYAGKLLFESLAGIRFESEGIVTVTPIIDGSLEWCRGQKELDCGIVGVDWRRGERDFMMHVGLPTGLRAKIKLPFQIVGQLITAGYDVPKEGIITADSSVEISADTITGLKVQYID
jgi:hypothetical protein